MSVMIYGGIYRTDLCSYFIPVLQTGYSNQNTILLRIALYFTEHLGDILH